MRRAAVACGKRLVKKGVLDEPQDAIFFYPVEIALALNPTANKERARDVLKRRKEECERYLTADHPVFLGDGSKFAEACRLDPILAIGASSPIDSAEKLGVTLVGGAGAPGVVEGTARVVRSIAEIEQVQTGDILVSPSTSPQWVTVFGIIKGVVTDMGGPMAHAVIVAREYSMPAVVGTLEATSKIKSGQRIRVDGNNLTVQILG
jgi:phosphohistidine swiveling domain-containing protein